MEKITMRINTEPSLPAPRYPYLFPNPKIREPARIAAKTSATGTASHTPSIPQRAGKIIRAPHLSRSVLTNEISAEIRPLFKAVNNDEPKTLMPP